MPNDKATVERALQVAAHEADVLKVKEEGGNNRGKRVEMYLKGVGLGPGNPWCAAFVSYCLLDAGYPFGPTTGRAAVRNWKAWADKHGKSLYNAMLANRGDLGGWLNPNKTGHIFFIAEVKKTLGIWWVRTIEGNSNEDGSREGDRVVRKWRRVTSKMFFIRLY